MSAQGRHARHHYGTGSAAVVAGAILTVCAALILAAFLTAGRAAGPETFMPGPKVTAAQPSLAPFVTAHRETAAMHRAHIAHLARLHAAHVKHLRHLSHLSA